MDKKMKKKCLTLGKSYFGNMSLIIPLTLALHYKLIENNLILVLFVVYISG